MLRRNKFELNYFILELKPFGVFMRSMRLFFKFNLISGLCDLNSSDFRHATFAKHPKYMSLHSAMKFN